MESTTARVTVNGQISIPAAIRRRWGSSSVLVIDRGDYAIVRPVPEDPIATLMGVAAGPGPNSDEVRAAERAADSRRA